MVDGVGWYKGKASCILLGNVGKLFGGVEAFEDAPPTTGSSNSGVVTAEGLLEWGRMLARTAVGTASNSPFAQTTKARAVKVKLNRKVLYELDGGDRKKAKTFKVKVEAAGHHRLRSGTMPTPCSGAPTRTLRAWWRVSREEPMQSFTVPRAVGSAESAGQSFVQSRGFEWLSRAGFVARALIYGIIGILALKLALGHGGKLTNQQGALHTVAHQPFGKLCSHSSRSVSAATPSGGSFALRSGTARRAPTAASTASRRWRAGSSTARFASSPSRSCWAPAAAARATPRRRQQASSAGPPAPGSSASPEP